MNSGRPRDLNVIALFRRAAHLMVLELVERLAHAGYSDVPAACHPVFENIDPGGTRLTVLAARSDMTHQSMGELVGIMEDRGYLRRRPDPSDGRARLVCLTAKGRRLLATARREIVGIEASWNQAWREAGIEGDLKGLLKATMAGREPGGA